MNRLAHELSPYLLQHAENPVDWFPWSEEAFELAEREAKPIFLSIGFSSCHWCHEMERESFDDDEVAQVLNRVFVCVKVDREEHPEVDSLYMDFGQILMNGGGGWPLNLLLTPQREPFFALTYVGKSELIGLAEQVEASWRDRREEICDNAHELTDKLKEQSIPERGELPGPELVPSVAELFLRLADPLHGGIGTAPKFPMAYVIDFMLEYGKSRDEARALFFAQRTLENIARGGIRDHVHGGFARYTVDEAWMVPHFEKMLLDNAMLARSYLLAWKCWGTFEDVCRETCEYLVTVLQRQDGGFCTGEAADSAEGEGAFTTWSIEELAQILGDDANLFCAFYGASAGRNVLHIPVPLEDFARANDLDAQALGEELQGLLEQLRKSHRPRPVRDEKVVASYNGLAIRALVEAGEAFGASHWIEAALAAANAFRGDALPRYLGGGLGGFLEDFAAMIAGTITLHQQGLGEIWLEWARELAEAVESSFAAPNGGYFRSNGHDPHLLLRRVELYDGAEPSGNGLHCENLLRLYQITGDRRYLERAEGVMRVATPFLQQHPLGGAQHVAAIQRYFSMQK